MPPQITPDNNELVMNFMFMLASLNRHGLKITNMQQLHSYLQQLAPFTELRALFGQTSEPLYQVRIANRPINGEVAVFHGPAQLCLDYAKNSVMTVLDCIGEQFHPVNSTYHFWQSQHFLVYVVPHTFKI